MAVESVIRKRSGGGVDENGDPIVVTAPDLTIVARGVAPGATAENQAVARDGESIEFTVYLPQGSDVEDGDQLLIRGRTYDVRVRDWRSPKSSMGIIEVLATRKVG